MMITNLKTNECAEISTYGNSKEVMLPAVLLYWGNVDATATTESGTIVRGKLLEATMLDYFSEVCRFDVRAFLGKSVARPAVLPDGTRPLPRFKALPKVQVAEYD